jgi:cytochrome c biogenesis protein CcmG, thiol:disulfide interchange protein DsbE
VTQRADVSVGSESPTAAPVTPVGPGTVRVRRRRGRLVLWSALAVLVTFAVLLAFLATVGPTKANSTLLGKAAPPIRGTELATGKSVALSDFAGKWVLINFAASWCIPCQQEMPQLQKLNKAAPRYGATLLSVTYDPGDTAGLRGMLANDHATWPAVSDAAADVTWGVHGGIPQSFLVDPAGVVVEYFPSSVDASEVESTIAPGAARPASTGS